MGGQDGVHTDDQVTTGIRKATGNLYRERTGRHPFFGDDTDDQDGPRITTEARARSDDQYDSRTTADTRARPDDQYDSSATADTQIGANDRRASWLTAERQTVADDQYESRADNQASPAAEAAGHLDDGGSADADPSPAGADRGDPDGGWATAKRWRATEEAAPTEPANRGDGGWHSEVLAGSSWFAAEPSDDGETGRKRSTRGRRSVRSNGRAGRNARGRGWPSEESDAETRQDNGPSAEAAEHGHDFAGAPNDGGFAESQWDDGSSARAAHDAADVAGFERESEDRAGGSQDGNGFAGSRQGGGGFAGSGRGGGGFAGAAHDGDDPAGAAHDGDDPAGPAHNGGGFAGSARGRDGFAGAWPDDESLGGAGRRGERSGGAGRDSESFDGGGRRGGSGSRRRGERSGGSGRRAGRSRGSGLNGEGFGGGGQDADPESVARAICLRLLTMAPKTRAQLAEALRKRDVPDEAAEAVLSRFSELGLINDEAFAEAWVDSRHHGRGLAKRALAAELRHRGVDTDTVKEAVERLDPDQEAETARRLVERKLASTRSLDPQTRTRRLAGMLARKGYSSGLAYRVIREALEQEGIEMDEDFP
ncbi:recombination regulator RecX [Nonomuraea angiospora]|uniref:recombination regulator RecX n=1 Tax=Nonomuraea angiospora TaxID=46172 RepID=UPI00379C74E5